LAEQGRTRQKLVIGARLASAQTNKPLSCGVKQMPFKRRSWTLPFERAAQTGKEFILPITANSVRNHWTIALQAISRQTPQRAGGVLVIRYHGKPLGVLGQFQILRDILLAWNQGINSEHPTIEAELALLADSTRPANPQDFRPRIIGVRMKPRSIAALFHDEESSVTAILKYRRYPCAFLISLPLLARFRQDQSAREWRESILNWMFQTDWLYPM
jgi:hypothetical protein